MAVNLFMSAIAAALGEAFVSLSADPLLVWNYGTMAVLAFIGGVCFTLQYRKLDQEEDELNMLPRGQLQSSGKDVEDTHEHQQVPTEIHEKI